MQGQTTPLNEKPASNVLAAVARAYADCHKWPAAMAVTLGLASTRPEAAVDVIVHILDGQQASGSSAGQAASGMPLLHRTAHTAGVVQVGAASHTGEARSRCDLLLLALTVFCCVEGAGCAS